jgi:AraC-like DNA-binding protein
VLNVWLRCDGVRVGVSKMRTKGFVGPTSREVKIQRACAQLVSDPTRRWSLSELADVAGFERTHFSKIFRETLGISFSAWDRQVRVQLAVRLLNDTAWPIKTIALAVGYCDVTTFERNFRKVEGVAPNAYRKNQRRSNVVIEARNGGSAATAARRAPSFSVTIAASTVAVVGGVRWSTLVHAENMNDE